MRISGNTFLTSEPKSHAEAHHKQSFDKNFGSSAFRVGDFIRPGFVFLDFLRQKFTFPEVKNLSRFMDER